jgi:hypothetical protein
MDIADMRIRRCKFDGDTAIDEASRVLSAVLEIARLQNETEHAAYTQT